MIIDMLSEKPFTLVQIMKRVQTEIASKWSVEAEANIQRKIQGLALKLYTLTPQDQLEVDRYKTDLDKIQVEAAQAVIDNKHLINVIEYENAINRLKEYILEDGSPSIPIYDDQIDPNTGKVVNVKVRDTIAIPPIPLLVDEVTIDPLTGKSITTKVMNPLVLKDRDERLLADTIVKAATPKILADFTLRNV